MIVPDFWAEAIRHHHEANKKITLRRFGWSMDSPEAASTMAESRVEEALRKLQAGEPLPHREPKTAYNGADGLPIREEVIRRIGDDVITRNGYGARCLNTPDVLFADIDFDPNVSLKSSLIIFLVLALLSLLAGPMAGGMWTVIGLLVLSLILTPPLGRLARRIDEALRGNAEQQVRKQVTAFLAGHPDWNLRLYRTPGGLRLLATHRTFSPLEPEVQDFFLAISADPLYVRMCLNQQCFRARLTAKPWRIGIASHMKPRPGIWPVAPERLDERNTWIEAYERQARTFAACRFVESLGSGRTCARAREVAELHDRESRANNPSIAIA